MNNEQVIKIEQDKISQLMCQILDLSQETGEKVRAAIKDLGIKNFFLNANTLNISFEEIDRILALRQIIEVKELEYQIMEGGKKDAL